jgi:hypothetical protein
MPSTIPLVALLVTLRISTQIIVPRPHAVWRIATLWLGVTLGCIISFASAGSAAINSLTPSIAYSAVFSALGFIPFIACAKLRVKGFAFPASWATWWWLITCESPVGRLGAWSPLSGYEAYIWTRPFVGELAVDWVVAAWCEILTGFAVAQIMGRVNNDEDALITEREASMVLPSHDVDTLPANDASPLLGNARTDITPEPKKRVVKPSSQITLMGLMVVAAAIPSTFLDPLPPPLYRDHGRDIGVACILPLLDDRHPPFDTFLAETRMIGGRAHIALWPEGAVAFDSETERNTRLEEVQKTATSNGIWIGVGFTEPALGDDKGKRRNGLAVVSREGVVLEYYKRHLVPRKHCPHPMLPPFESNHTSVVESFPQVEGKIPPSVIEITLGSKQKKTAQWNITLSAGVCLDFAHPAHDLASKPSLILGPARTWHRNVGRVMMEMATQRANELGTRVLWCDGGDGGLSGVVGMGQSGVQVGHGTWVQRLSFDVPVDAKKTMYGTVGTFPGLLFVWSLVFTNIPMAVLPSMMHRAFWNAIQGRVVRFINERR